MIEEGEVKIEIRDFEQYKGPGKKKAGFYNPTLEIDRDINVIFCQYIANKGAKKMLDGLSATGIRGIRIAKEVKSIDVHINDINPASYEIIRENVKKNKVNVKIFCENIHSLLLKEKYDYVDIDPYGSPVPFISCVFKGLKRKGYTSFTATDTATLCGIYKKACIRRYHALPLSGQAMKEIGLRILIGYIARQTTTFEYGLRPILSYAYGHFFRIYARLEKGARKADETFSKIGWIFWKNGWRISSFDRLPTPPFAGPLWIGKLHEKNFLNEMEKIMTEKKLGRKKEIEKMLRIFKEEETLPPLFYESRYISKEMKAKQPKLISIIEKLRRKGYDAGRTHFMPDAFKTNAPYDEIKKLFLNQ
ncbi:MAG: tRNA (guanine(10)-N(2))-dimethyltransferase [Thermoplasmata archaeon]|nr:MAG: tRNA (guanine(10)-N(2))-dimethyltransferase [Thermoplasmata archaeon]